jgi:hypothetical protein
VNIPCGLGETIKSRVERTHPKKSLHRFNAKSIPKLAKSLCSFWKQEIQLHFLFLVLVCFGITVFNYEILQQNPYDWTKSNRQRDSGTFEKTKRFIEIYFRAGNEKLKPPPYHEKQATHFLSCVGYCRVLWVATKSEWYQQRKENQYITPWCRF